MKKIKIVLVISEEELKNDKNEISNFIRNLNDIYEDYNVYIRLITDEKELKEDELKESDLFLILVQSNMNKKSNLNFKLAYNNFKNNLNPKISTYIKKTDNVNQTVIDFMKYLDEDLGHFYTNYENIDTIKLNIAMQLQTLGFEEGKFDVKNGKLIFDNKEIMSLENIPMFFNNTEINKLKEQYKNMEEEYWDLKEIKNQNPDDDSLLEKYLGVKKQKDEISKNIKDIELSIINFEKSFIEDLENGRLSKKQVYARKCLEEGDIEAAKAALDFDEIKKEIEQVSKFDELNKSKISIMIRELYQRIDILEMEKPINKLEIEKIYEEIIKVQKQYGLKRDGQYFYAKFLFDEGRVEESLQMIESYIYYLKAEDSKMITIRNYQLYADCLLEKNRVDQAVENYVKALDMFLKKTELQVYEIDNWIDLSFKIAQLFCSLKKFDKAINYYHICSNLNDQAYKKREEDKYNYLNLVLNYNLGYAYFKNREIVKAHSRFGRTIALAEEYIQKDNIYEIYFFELYRNIGLLYKSLDSFHNARLCYEKCIYLLEQLSTCPLTMTEYIDYYFDHLDDENKDIKYYNFDFDVHYANMYEKYELIGVSKPINKKEYYIERLETVKKEYKELLEAINENN